MRIAYIAPILAFSLLFMLVLNGHAQIRQTKANSGIAPVVKPNPGSLKDDLIADFKADTTLVEAGNPIKFTNLSQGEPTFYKWTTPGASPSISYSRDPLVIYHTPGTYSVTLYISSANGSNELIKEDYIEVIEPISNLPPSWEYPTTLSQHTLMLPLQINARIFDVPLDSGDYIGVFHYNDENQLKCAGAVLWNGDPTIVITAQGDSPLTGEKDGFNVGEVFNWKIFSLSNQAEFMATPVYDASAPYDFFLPYGLTIMADLYAGLVYELEVAEGWSGISSPVAPWKNNIDSLLAPNMQDIIYMKNQDGELFPEQNINTIVNWGNTGYLAKLNNPTTMVFKGYPIDNPAIALTQGWNMLNIPIACETEISTLLQENQNQIEIISEIAGLNVFWPEYGIGTLTILKPGKSYLVKAKANITLEFPACENK